MTTIVAALASGASAWADPADPVNPLTKQFLQGKPLDICDQGSFYVGGVPKNTIYANSALAAGAPADLIIGQMYVQFQIPTKHRQWPPRSQLSCFGICLGGDTGWADGAGYPMRYKTIFPCSR